MLNQSISTEEFNRLLQKHGNRIGRWQFGLLIGIIMVVGGFVWLFSSGLGLTTLLLGITLSYTSLIVIMDSESFIDKMQTYSVSSD